MRGPEKKRPPNLTLPPDGQKLEDLIGELQSLWGVPQYPQEYRITIKIAETKPERQGAAVEVREERSDPPEKQEDGAAPRRERAPAAPRLHASDDGKAASREGAPRGRRRGRRRRGKSGGGPAGGGSQPQ